MNSFQKAAPRQIALDGPSASGKSTVGTKLAARYGCDFLDTGMMYRAVTLLALRNETPLDDASALGRIADTTDFAPKQFHDGAWRLLACGTDITEELYGDEINRHVSPVSAISQVRTALVRKQRAIAAKRPIVMAGRDIGTVVLVDAPIKIYLEASAAIRAARRTRDATGNSAGASYNEILRSIARRDEIDSHRADSPLKPADDAFIVTTDDMSIEEVVDRIAEIIEDAKISERAKRIEKEPAK